jgi:hypothetical protein
MTDLNLDVSTPYGDLSPQGKQMRTIWRLHAVKAIRHYRYTEILRLLKTVQLPVSDSSLNGVVSYSFGTGVFCIYNNQDWFSLEFPNIGNFIGESKEFGADIWNLLQTLVPDLPTVTHDWQTNPMPSLIDIGICSFGDIRLREELEYLGLCK